MILGPRLDTWPVNVPELFINTLNYTTNYFWRRCALTDTTSLKVCATTRWKLGWYFFLSQADN